MSLINQMLKDIEQRRPRKAVPGIELLAGLKTPSKAKISGLKFFYLLICLTLIAVLVGYLSGKRVQPAAISDGSKVQASADKIVPAAAAVQEAALKPVQLLANGLAKPESLPPPPALVQSITFSGNVLETDMVLRLNYPSLYQVDLMSPNELILSVDNAYLVSSVALVPPMAAAIRNVQLLKSSDGQLKLKVSLKPGAQLQRLAMDENTPATLTLKFSVDNKMAALDGGPIDSLPAASPSIKQFDSEENKIKTEQNILERATLLVRQKRLHEAERYLNIGLKAQPDAVPLVILRARIDLMNDKPQRALSLLDTVHPAIMDAPDYYLLLAAVYQRLDKPLKAAEIYNLLIELQPENGAYWLGLGVSLEAAGKTGAAVEAYRKASAYGGFQPQVNQFLQQSIQKLTGG